MPISHFEEDQEISQTADLLGLSVERFNAIEITDMKAIESAGLTISKPDYNRIRRLLMDGADVKGAELGRIEYRLKRKAR